MLFFYIVIAIVVRCFWGIVTDKVVKNKNYTENWFIWGFLFGLIAFVVALTKTEKTVLPMSYYDKSPYTSSRDMIANGSGWYCKKCKKTNPSYVGTCSCGNTKAANNAKSTVSTDNSGSSAQKTEDTKKNVEEVTKNTETADEIKTEEKNVRILKQYKDLLDAGVITQQEFDNKKKQIFGSIDS
ncbi:MAG: SHOCT domain-containing protein [Lachnospiraceae bacterium]|nr:SHOCT domain-containing protein [Lachnospiraceae bacterium]